jgi:hypothetical protein
MVAMDAAAEAVEAEGAFMVKAVKAVAATTS